MSAQDMFLSSGYIRMACPKCGAGAQLQRAEKLPEGEVRVYECEVCHHRAEVIAGPNAGPKIGQAVARPP